jgi:predicted DNA-binding transcriptional regulator AlpA
MTTTALTAAQKRDKELYGAPLDSVLRSAAPKAREIAAKFPSRTWALVRITWLLWPELEPQLHLQPNGGIGAMHDARWYEMLQGYFAIRHGHNSRQFRALTDKECIDTLLADMVGAEQGKQFHNDETDCYVSLQQCASIVSKSKKTLFKKYTDGDLPAPCVPGGNGKAHEWRWSKIRPCLEHLFSRKLPDRFPGDRFLKR